MAVVIDGSANAISYTASLDSTKGATSGNPAPSAGYILAANPSAASGLYWIAPPGQTAQQLYCDMAYDGGGWMLIASNDWRDTTIPSGTSRQSTSYELDRNGGTALVGAQGINPNGDYIIGNLINYLPFDQVRITGWGYQSTNGTYSYPAGSFSNNQGTTLKSIWPLNSKGSDRLLEIVPRAYVTITGTDYPGANYFILDAIKQDRVNGGYTANANQTTIGAAGVGDATGDPTAGTYTGHGATEGAGEGWYNTTTNNDAQGYATWVKDTTDYTKTITIPAGITMSATAAGSFVATGRIVNSTRFTNNTRVALSTSSNYTMWSAGNVTKLQANTTLIILGQMCFTGGSDAGYYECGAWWQIGSSGKRYDGLIHTAAADSAVDTQVHVGWHIMGQYTTTATGALAVSIGWTTADSSVVRPHEVWNPNATDDARSQQHTSEILILEVGN